MPSNERVPVAAAVPAAGRSAADSRGENFWARSFIWISNRHIKDAEEDFLVLFLYSALPFFSSSSSSPAIERTCFNRRPIKQCRDSHGNKSTCEYINLFFFLSLLVSFFCWLPSLFNIQTRRWCAIGVSKAESIRVAGINNTSTLPFSALKGDEW